MVEALHFKFTTATRCVVAAVLVVASAPARSQTAPELSDPCDRILAHIGAAVGDRAHQPLPSEAREQLEAVRGDVERCADRHIRAQWYFQMADIVMKLEGDAQTEEYYAAAVREDPENPAFEIHWAEYMRNFRGPLQPLVVETERHLAAAVRKLDVATDLTDEQRRLLHGRIIRNQIALYERDGAPVFYTDFLPFLPDAEENRPIVFFSTQNRFARSLGDFDAVDEVRTLTEAALFASGPTRLDRPLFTPELRAFIHPHDQFETFNRFRIRYRWLPMFEVFYGYADVPDSQTTNFYRPGEFNDVSVQRYGIAAERAIDAYPFADILLRVEAGWGDRWGLIEFQPSGKETLEAVTAKGVFSRFIPGENHSDKLSLEVVYTNQDYDQQVNNPIDPRGLEIVAATLHYQRYSLASYQRLYEPRSNEVFLGAALGQETFGALRQNRDDYFGGLAVRSLPYLDSLPAYLSLHDHSSGRLDLILQPTLFTSNHNGIDEKGNQAAATNHDAYQTIFTVVFRWIDYANDATLSTVPAFGPLHLSQLNLVLPLSQAVATKGPGDYDDFSIGADLFATVIGDFSTTNRFAGATLLASAGYTYQRFYHLADDVNLWHVSLRLGF